MESSEEYILDSISEAPIMLEKVTSFEWCYCFLYSY